MPGVGEARTRWRALKSLTASRERADETPVIRPISILRRPGAVMIATLAAFDLAYRLLLRESVRRKLGMPPQPKRVA
jgi:hypothetical protein